MGLNLGRAKNYNAETGGYREEFMANIKECSESWRAAAEKEK